MAEKVYRSWFDMSKYSLIFGSHQSTFLSHTNKLIHSVMLSFTESSNISRYDFATIIYELFKNEHICVFNLVNFIKLA